MIRKRMIPHTPEDIAVKVTTLQNHRSRKCATSSISSTNPLIKMRKRAVSFGELISFLSIPQEYPGRVPQPCRVLLRQAGGFDSDSARSGNPRH